MNKKGLISVCLAAAVGLGLTACGSKETATTPDSRTPVEVSSMTKQNMVEYYTASGVAAPIQEIDILPKTPSKILNTYAEVGDQVTAGSVLCSLDASDITSQLNQMNAQINQSRAGVKVSQVNREKAQTTGREQALSQAQSAIDQAQSGVDQAENGVAQAQAALDNANAGIGQAQAAVDNARQTMESAKKEYDNNQILLDAGVISQSAFDGVKAKYDSAVYAYDNAQRSYDNAVRSAETAKTSLETAQKSLSNAQKSYSTARDNYDLTTKAQKDNIAAANAQYDQAVAGVGALEAQRDNLQNKLGEMQITSPVNGTVVTRNAKVGEFASQQMPLYTVIDLSKVLINVTVGEQMINRLAVGQSIIVNFRSLEGQQFTGSIDTISYSVDPQKAGYSVNVLVDNPDKMIKSGMFAEVKIAVSEKPDTFAIDSGVIFNDEGRYYVYTVDTENKAVKKEIQVGIKNDEYTEVFGGLEMTDRIVSKGQANLMPNMEVKIVNSDTTSDFTDSMPVDGTAESEGGAV